MRLFVGIATSGREAILEHALRSVAGQSRPPEVVFVCRPLGEPASPAPSPAGLDVVNLFAEKGSCTQRNAILDALEGKGGALLIMDDDIILHPRYLERIERLFCAHPEVAIANGRLLADGIGGAGIAPPEAERLIAAEPDAAVEPSPAIMERETAYGCNMATNLDLGRVVALRRKPSTLCLAGGRRLFRPREGAGTRRGNEPPGWGSPWGEVGTHLRASPRLFADCEPHLPCCERAR